MLDKLENIPWVSVANSADYYGRGNLELLVVDSPLCSAALSLQGGQLLSFFSKSKQQEMLWLSPLASLQAGAAIRGGIPVCAPWFGVNRYQAGLPKHGFVRNKDWSVDTVTTEADGSVEVTLRYVADADDAKLFAEPFELTQTLRLSSSIQQQLTITNTGSQPAIFSWALHSYFNAGPQNSEVIGLEGHSYLDATQQFERQQQSGSLRFDGEIDRVYEGCEDDQRIRIGGSSDITIHGNQCPTVITWNPGAELAGTMADVQNGYQEYICVERGAAFADEFSLQPSEAVTASQTLAFAAAARP